MSGGDYVTGRSRTLHARQTYTLNARLTWCTNARTTGEYFFGVSGDRQVISSIDPLANPKLVAATDCGLGGWSLVLVAELISFHDAGTTTGENEYFNIYGRVTFRNVLINEEFLLRTPNFYRPEDPPITEYTYTYRFADYVANVIVDDYGSFTEIVQVYGASPYMFEVVTPGTIPNFRVTVNGTVENLPGLTVAPANIGESVAVGARGGPYGSSVGIQGHSELTGFVQTIRLRTVVHEGDTSYYWDPITYYGAYYLTTAATGSGSASYVEGGLIASGEDVGGLSYDCTCGTATAGSISINPGCGGVMATPGSSPQQVSIAGDLYALGSRNSVPTDVLIYLHSSVREGVGGPYTAYLSSDNPTGVDLWQTIHGVSNHFDSGPIKVGGYEFSASFTDSRSIPPGGVATGYNHRDDNFAVMPSGRRYAYGYTNSIGAPYPQLPQAIYGNQVGMEQVWPVSGGGIRLSQASSVTYFGAPWAVGSLAGMGQWSGGTGAPGGSVTLSTAATAGGTGTDILHAVVTGSSPNAFIAANTVPFGYAYRFVHIRVRSIGAANLPGYFYPHGVSGGGASNSYPFTTGADGVWKDVIIDLQRGRIVLDPLPPFNSHYQHGWASGVSSNGGMSINGLAAGTYEFAYIKGERHNETLVSFLPGPDTETGHVVALTDSFRSLDITLAPGGYVASNSNPVYTVDQGVTELNAIPYGGWTATAVQPPDPSKPPLFHATPAIWNFSEITASDNGLCGILWNTGISAIDGSQFLDRSMTGSGSSVVLPWGMYGRINLYPGIGQPFQNNAPGPWGNSTTLNHQCVVGGQVVGILTGGYGGIITVKRQTDGSIVGTGTVITARTSDSGVAPTGPPGIPPSVGLTVFATNGMPVTEGNSELGTPAPYDHFYTSNGVHRGVRAYFLFVTLPIADERSPHLLNTRPGGYLASVHCQSGKGIIFRRTAGEQVLPDNTPWAVEVQATHGAYDARPILLYDVARACLRLMFTRYMDAGATDGGTVYEMTSYDDGATWSDPPTPSFP